MKRKLLVLICLFISSVSLMLAQSFSIPLPNYSYWGDLSANTANVNIPITNSTNNDIDVIVQKTQNNLAGAHSSLFCFGISCYDSSVSNSAVITFAGHAVEYLIADLNKNSTLGVSYVTYRIFDINNTNDFAEVTIDYHITTTGIAQVNNVSIISVPQPNPADKFSMVSYKLNGDYQNYKLEIYNILGNKVKQISFENSGGSMFLPVSELTSGVYFYSLVSGNKVISTNKLVVAHKN